LAIFKCTNWFKKTPSNNIVVDDAPVIPAAAIQRGIATPFIQHKFTATELQENRARIEAAAL
jgi:hypothetical protein